MYQRVITVTGSAVKNPVNLLAPVGTPFSHLIEGGRRFQWNPARVISGGPMMGFAQYDMSVTMGKASNCVLCLSKEDLPATSANPTCIRCARCVNVCPMHLTPPLYEHVRQSPPLERGGGKSTGLWTAWNAEAASMSARLEFLWSSSSARPSLPSASRRPKSKEGIAWKSTN